MLRNPQKSGRRLGRQKSMMQTNFVISLADMRYVEIHCDKCAATVTLDMEKPFDFSGGKGAFAPKECPGCHKDYDSAIKPAVNDFQQAYQSLLQIPKSVTFRGVSREAI
jgi:hypothetical protein